jgi:hypothetical protein
VTSNESQKIEASLLRLENNLLKKYNDYGYNSQKNECLINKHPISSLPFEPFNINVSVLNEAIAQIKMDIRFVFLRGEDLIGNLRISEGKVAGIITYRLARAHIINICRICNDCSEKCIAQLNLIFAIRIGFDYIHKKYDDLPEGIRQELSYAMKYRHVNQEMLGLVFDTFNNALFHTKNNTRKIS